MDARVNIAKVHGAGGLSGMPLMEPAEFVVFQLGEHEYGIDMEQVQRLRGYRSLTWIANGTEYLEGVAISDGVIMPIVDMRRHVDIAMPAFTHSTAVMILNIRKRSIGLVVDSVSDVISLSADHVRPVPASGSDAMPAPGHLIGCAIYEGRNLILLDIEKLMQDAGIILLDIEKLMQDACIEESETMKA